MNKQKTTGLVVAATFCTPRLDQVAQHFTVCRSHGETIFGLFLCLCV